MGKIQKTVYEYKIFLKSPQSKLVHKLSSISCAFPISFLKFTVPATTCLLKQENGMNRQLINTSEKT